MGILDMFRPKAAATLVPAPVENDQVVEGEGWFLDLTDPRLPDLLRGGRESEAGIRVSVSTAMKIPTVFRCVSLISETMSTLPMHLLSKETKKKASDHPLYKLLHRRPNPIQTAYDFRKLMQMRVLTKGNAYARIVRSQDIRRGRSKVVGLVPLEPDAVEPKVASDGTLTYRYTAPGGAITVYRMEEILHLRAMSFDGITGIPLSYIAADAIGLATAAQQALSRLYRNGSFVNGYLSHPKSLSQPARQRLRADWEGRFSGSENAGKTPVFEEGLVYTPIGTNAKDAQSHETRSFQIEEILRVFGVPRPYAMMDDTSWGSGIEVLGQAYHRNCISNQIEMWQQTCEQSLLTEEEQDEYEIKINPAALLRGSMADQGEYFAKALGSGGQQAWMTPNEIREVIDMPPHPDGDKLENPMTAQAAAPAGNDPAATGAPANG